MKVTRRTASVVCARVRVCAIALVRASLRAPLATTSERHCVRVLVRSVSSIIIVECARDPIAREVRPFLAHFERRPKLYIIQSLWALFVPGSSYEANWSPLISIFVRERGAGGSRQGFVRAPFQNHSHVCPLRRALYVWRAIQ